MLIRPSFKKSLIVEQFQENYLNNSLLLLLVAEVVKEGVSSLIEDIRTPNYIEDSSWEGISDFVFIPKETVMNHGRLTRITC